LFIHWMIYVSMANDDAMILTGENWRTLEISLFQCLFVHHRSHMDWPKRKPGHPRWEADSVVRGRRQTACAMARPKDTPVMPMENKHNLFPQLIRIPYHNTTFFYSNANSATNTLCIWKHVMVLLHEASSQKLHTWMWVTTQVKYRYSCMSWLLTVYADGGMSRNPHIRHAPLFFILILEKKWMRAMRASTVSRRLLYLFQCCPCA
jgi:hypothetical protein